MTVETHTTEESNGEVTVDSTVTTTTYTVTDENPLYLDPEDYDEWLEDAVEYSEDYDEWVSDRPIEQEYIDEYTEEYLEWLDDTPEKIDVNEYGSAVLTTSSDAEI
jgi:hypothetical protein